jgi:membrane protein required for colicin V production
MLDIIIIIAAILSFYVGYRRGFIVQLISLVALYVAILLAPSIAEPIGSIFMGSDAQGIAFVAGFFLVVAISMMVVWFVAPLIGKLIFWNPFKQFDALAGGLLNLVVSFIIASSLFAAFDYANISNKLNQENIDEYINTINSGNIEAQVKALADGDIETMRKYFRPRYVEYETLESSAFFDPMASFGRFITPSMDGFNETMREEAKKAVDDKYDTIEFKK